MLLNNYDSLNEDVILAMGKEDLQQAVLRMLQVNTRTFSGLDFWYGDFLLPDELADAFRGRIK